MNTKPTYDSCLAAHACKHVARVFVHGFERCSAIGCLMTHRFDSLDIIIMYKCVQQGRVDVKWHK